MSYRGPVLFALTAATIAHGEKADDPMVPYDPRRQDHIIEWTVGSSANAPLQGHAGLAAAQHSTASALGDGSPFWTLTNSGFPPNEIRFTVDGQAFAVRFEITSRSA